jgi:hypothetical protein
LADLARHRGHRRHRLSVAPWYRRRTTTVSTTISNTISTTIPATIPNTISATRSTTKRYLSVGRVRVLLLWGCVLLLGLLSVARLRGLLIVRRHITLRLLRLLLSLIALLLLLLLLLLLALVAALLLGGCVLL